MFDNMRRLHPRGPTSRGISVDSDGAMLGPNCVLVEHTLGTHQPVSRRAARVIQGLLLPDHREPDWLFDQCGRIARALDEGQVALAQIYGLRISIGELDDRRLAQLGHITAFTRAGFNPDEPRVPKGDPHGGEWTNGGGDESASDSAPNSPSSDIGVDASNGDGDNASGSGSTASPTLSDLGAGDSASGGDGGGDDGTDGDSDSVPTPSHTADASDAPPQSPTGGTSSSSSTAGPAIEYIIVEPQGSAPAAASSPATDGAAPAIGTPTPLGSAGLDYQSAPPAALSVPTEPTSGAGPEAINELTASAPNPKHRLPMSNH
jgi:hypothetical protein